MKYLACVGIARKGGAFEVKTINQKGNREMERKIKKAQLIDLLHDKKRDYYEELLPLTKTVFVREEIGSNTGTAFEFDRYGELSGFYTWLEPEGE